MFVCFKIIIPTVFILGLILLKIGFLLCCLSSSKVHFGLTIVYPQNGLSVQADPLPLPIKLVRPEDLTKLSLMEEEEQQAPPLPTKVKLPDTDI